MSQSSCDTLVISDLHLGSEVSQARQALRLLESLEFQRLILLGDIFCDLNFARLKKHHWNFLGYIRKLSNPKRGKEVVWVEGNHDKGLSTVMSHLVGIPVYQQYEWELGGIPHVAVHGHQFDRFTLHNGILCSIGASAFLQLQKLDSKSQSLTRAIDRINSSWLGLAAKVRRGAFHLAASSGAQRVFCGHTHVPAHETLRGVEYLNSGSWVSDRPSYVTVDHETAALRFWETDGLSESDDLTLAEDEVSLYQAVS